MGGANLVGVFVGGFVVCLFLWISEFCWSAGGGAEIRQWCKPGVVRGVRFEVIKVQRVVNEPVFDGIQGFGEGFATVLEGLGE